MTSLSRPWTRRSLLAFGAAAVAIPARSLFAHPDSKTASGFVIDGCGGPGDPAAEDAAELSSAALADARASGIHAVNLTVGPVGNRPSLAAFEGIFRDLAKWEGEIARHPEVFLRVTRPSDLETARQTGRVGLVYGLQDGVAFHDDLTRLDVLQRFGLRIIQPTYNLRNLLGDGCLEPDGAGLSKAGQEAIRRMNALGILIDLSHCGRRTTRDALAASGGPVAFTHTGCAAVADHPRNKTDEELRALAVNGGVAGIYFMPYLSPGRQPEAEDVMRHVEHALNVAGEDHVGVGTDGSISPVSLTAEQRARFQADIDQRKKRGIGAPGEIAGVFPFVPELNVPRRIQKLGELLSGRGHSTARVEKILGGNFARLFRDVWKEHQ